MEKNPTIVNFPVKGIDFGDFLAPEAKEKYKGTSTSYDLVANVVHEGQPTGGIYKTHVLHKGKKFFHVSQNFLYNNFIFSLTGSNNWYEMQDLHVNKVLPEILPLSEALVQIYERRK